MLIPRKACYSQLKPPPWLGEVHFPGLGPNGGELVLPVELDLALASTPCAK